MTIEVEAQDPRRYYFLFQWNYVVVCHVCDKLTIVFLFQIFDLPLWLLSC